MAEENLLADEQLDGEGGGEDGGEDDGLKAARVEHLHVVLTMHPTEQLHNDEQGQEVDDRKGQEPLWLAAHEHRHVDVAPALGAALRLEGDKDVRVHVRHLGVGGARHGFCERPPVVAPSWRAR